MHSPACGLARNLVLSACAATSGFAAETSAAGLAAARVPAAPQGEPVPLVTSGGLLRVHGTAALAEGVEVLVLRPALAGLPESLMQMDTSEVIVCERVRTGRNGRFGVRMPLGERVAFFAHTTDMASLVSPLVTSGDPVSMVLRPTRELSGVFRDVNDGRPIAGLALHAFLPCGGDTSLGLRLPLRTDSEGRYRVRVPLGTWVRIEARGDGWRVAHYVHEDLVNDFTVGRPAGKVSGRLLDAKGAAIQGALVVSRSKTLLISTTDEHGAFWFAEEAPAHHSVRTAWARGGHAFLLPGNAAEIAHRIPTADPALRIALRDPTGAPLRGAEVIVLTAPEGQVHRPGERPPEPRLLHADAAGDLTIPCRPTGRYLSVFVKAGGRWAWFFRGRAAEIGAVLTLSVRPTGAIHGRLPGDPEHFGAACRMWALRSPDDGANLLELPLGHPRRALRVHVDPAGRYAVNHLQPGRYLVVALLAGQVQRVAEVVVRDGPVRHDFEPLPGEVLHGIVKVNGRPAAGAVLTLILPPHWDPSTVVGRWMAANFPPMLPLTSDARGRFRFRSVPAEGVPMLIGHSGHTMRIDVQPAAEGVVVDVSTPR
jgi:hypothetical protein